MVKLFLRKITVLMTIIPVVLCTLVLHVQADIAYDPIEQITRRPNYLLPALTACAAAAVLLVFKIRKDKK
ncbi:MAG: hypothetical protein IIZ57_01415 [Solobacterium sp.]|nr:hypothetical protein [Solobacterium sp.]